MTGEPLSRRERLVLGAGLSVLSLVAEVAERLDRRDTRRWASSATPGDVRAQANQRTTTAGGPCPTITP